MTTLKNNPLYRIAFQSKVHGIDLYIPAEGAAYHTSRYMAAGAQDIYSSAGATKELTGKIYKEIKRLCNDAHSKKDISALMDINTWMDNLLYRHSYPIDELCSVRMGAIYSFMEDEDPDTMHDLFTQKKVAFAMGNFEQGVRSDPELYTFFLSMGIVYTPAYRELSDITTDTDYFSRRSETIAALTPQQSHSG